MSLGYGMLPTTVDRHRALVHVPHCAEFLGTGTTSSHFAQARAQCAFNRDFIRAFLAHILTTRQASELLLGAPTQQRQLYTSNFGKENTQKWNLDHFVGLTFQVRVVFMLIYLCGIFF